MDVSAQEARFWVLGLEEEDALSEHEQSDNDGDNEGRTVEGIEEEAKFHEDGLTERIGREKQRKAYSQNVKMENYLPH